MKASNLLALALLGAASAHAQTPLAKWFSDMHSDDPTARAEARSDPKGVFEKELPTIEKDSGVLCRALLDQDTYIQLQSAAILQAIVLAAPEHISVVDTCTSQLLQVASDHGETQSSASEAQAGFDNGLWAREDALFALAMHPGGASPLAQVAFISAFHSPIYRIAELGTAGLLKETGPNQRSNQLLIHTTLESTEDPKKRLNLLYAIAGARTPSNWLFDDAHRVLLDQNADEELKQAAIQAMAATATDTSSLLATMHTVAESSAYSKSVKLQAQGVINGLDAHP